MTANIEQRLKQIIIETLDLDDMSPDEIQSDEPLMGAGLSLDSIDALELVIRIEKEFGIKIKNSEEAREGLESVSKLKSFVLERQAAQS